MVSPMRVLMIGGTVFVGRHLAEAFVARGHDVTLFHRGLSNPGGMERCRHKIGDRDRDLGVLAGEEYDLVVDTSGYEVKSVRATAALAGACGARYVFISTISVYSDPARLDEAAPTAAIDDAEAASLAFSNYGALKAACERAIEGVLPGRVLVVRAGIIVGPHDYDERFAFLLRRVARGG
jgi:2'-hydroxyisoflavone reductase